MHTIVRGALPDSQSMLAYIGETQRDDINLTASPTDKHSISRRELATSQWVSKFTSDEKSRSRLARSSATTLLLKLFNNTVSTVVWLDQLTKYVTRTGLPGIDQIGSPGNHRVNSSSRNPSRSNSRGGVQENDGFWQFTFENFTYLYRGSHSFCLGCESYKDNIRYKGGIDAGIGQVTRLGNRYSKSHRHEEDELIFGNDEFDTVLFHCCTRLFGVRR